MVELDALANPNGLEMIPFPFLTTTYRDIELNLPIPDDSDNEDEIQPGSMPLPHGSGSERVSEGPVQVDSNSNDAVMQPEEFTRVMHMFRQHYVRQGLLREEQQDTEPNLSGSDDSDGDLPELWETVGEMTSGEQMRVEDNSEEFRANVTPTAEALRHGIRLERYFDAMDTLRRGVRLESWINATDPIWDWDGPQPEQQHITESRSQPGNVSEMDHDLTIYGSSFNIFPL